MRWSSSAKSGGVRAILISEGKHTAPDRARDRERDRDLGARAALSEQRGRGAAAVEPAGGGLVARRIGATRSTISRRSPTALVLDAEDPEAAGRGPTRCFERTALTDLRWTRLTRWRSALAHLFDLPQVRQGMRGVPHAVDRRAAIRTRRGSIAGWLQIAPALDVGRADRDPRRATKT